MDRGDIEQLAARVLDALETNPRTPADGDEQMRIEALDGAAKRLQQLMARTPWSFIPPAWLASIQAAFDPAVATLESYATTAEDIALPVTWAEIQRLWEVLAPLVAMSLPEESVAEDATAFRRSAAQLIRRLGDEVEVVKEEASQLRSRLEQLEAERTAAFAQLKAQQDAVTTTINEQASRLEQAIRANQDQFSAAQERHRQEFSEALTQLQATVSETVKNAENETTLAIDTVTERANERLEAIEAIEEKATKSYSAIGTASVAGHFQKNANDEQDQANLWRWFAVIGFVAVAVGTIIELFASDGALGWSQTRSRIPVIIGLGAFAAFAVAEARSHRRAAREARRREVELSSIDPFLVLIEDRDEAEKVKLDFARRIFVHQRSELPDAAEDDDEGR